MGTLNQNLAYFVSCRKASWSKLSEKLKNGIGFLWKPSGSWVVDQTCKILFLIITQELFDHLNF